MLYELIKMQSHACSCVCNYAKRNATLHFNHFHRHNFICYNNGWSKRKRLWDKNTVGSKGRDRMTWSTCGTGNNFNASFYATRSFQNAFFYSTIILPKMRNKVRNFHTKWHIFGFHFSLKSGPHAFKLIGVAPLNYVSQSRQTFIANSCAFGSKSNQQ